MGITAFPYTSVLSVPADRILGNNTGGTAAAIALTPAQVATMLALISDTAYNEATWNGVTGVAPSKNAVRDQIEVLSASISAAVSDTAYNATTWNGVTTIAPSKNAVRDAFQDGGVSPLFSGLTSLSDATISGLLIGKGTGSVATNSAVGLGVLMANTTGYGQTAVGYQALISNTTGRDNTALGVWSMRFNETGELNSVLGRESLYSNVSGSGNSASGWRVLNNNMSGNYNAAFGYQAAMLTAAGTGLETATSGSYFGSNCRGFSNSDNHAIVIGADAVGESATGIVIGSSYNSVSRFFGTPTYSDGTDSTKKLTLDMSGMGTGINRTLYFADDMVEFRRGTNAQVLRLDKTYTSATNFEALRIDASSSGPRIGSEIGSAGGTTRDLDFGYWDSAAAWNSNWLMDVGTNSTLTQTSDGQSIVNMYSHSSSAGNIIRGYRARGADRNNPTAILTNDIFQNLNALGHDGTAWSGVRAQWYIAASEDWTTAGHGTYQFWSTTANGALAAVAHMRLNHDGALVVGQGSIGVTATGGALEVKSTTEQLRLWYSAANYMTATVSSAGAVTFDANGASAGFTFSDSVSCSSSIKSTNATAGIGYGTGAGGTVTQATNKATGVTLNKTCGTITMNGAALAADTTVSFTVTNSACAATDVIVIQHDSAGTLGAYLVVANTPAAGSFQVSVRNVTAGSLSEAIVLRFAIIKAVVS